MRATQGGLSVDFVGHLEGPVGAGDLRTGPVRFVSDLRHRAYYQVPYACLEMRRAGARCLISRHINSLRHRAYYQVRVLYARLETRPLPLASPSPTPLTAMNPPLHTSPWPLPHRHEPTSSHLPLASPSPPRTHLFPQAVADGRFMIAAIGEREYFNARATSTVPAALITGLPLVTSGQVRALTRLEMPLPPL